jgi:large repetitive protein
VTYSGLTEGAHTFQVKAVDSAGNVDATPASHSWTIDVTAPETTIDSGPADGTTDMSATFVFSSSDPGSGFECSLDSASFTTCSSPETYTGLEPGSHTFAVRATDPAGNVDPSPATYSWAIT